MNFGDFQNFENHFIGKKKKNLTSKIKSNFARFFKQFLDKIFQLK